MRTSTFVARLLLGTLFCISCGRSSQSARLTEFTKDIVWCVPPGPDLRLSRQCTPTEAEYVRPSDPATFLSTPVTGVGYYFVKNELRAIRVFVAPEHSSSFREKVFQAFGSVTEPGDPPNWFASDDRTVALLFSGKTSSSNAVLEFNYIPGQRRRAGVDAP